MPGQRRGTLAWHIVVRKKTTGLAGGDSHYQKLLKPERFADREQKRMIADCKAAVKDLIQGD